MKLLSHLKKDMDFNQSLYGLVDVLKSISIAQYRVLEKKVNLFEKFFTCLEDFFGLIDTDSSEHPLINVEDRRGAVIAITSDGGLVGGLNAQVMNSALKEVRNNQAKLIVVGERGKVYAQENNIPFVAFSGIKDESRLTQAEELRDYIIAQELSRKLGALKIIYPYPISIISQAVRVLQLLPFSTAAMIKSKQDSQSPALKDAFRPALKDGLRPAELVLESSLDDIAGYLVYLFLGHKFYEIFGLGRLAELSGRFVHLENSKTKIEQLNKQLKQQYFRQRHELIDRNMRELLVARLQFK